VRSGLVAVGVVLALIGAAVVFSGLLIPSGSVSTQFRLNTLVAPNVVDQQTRVALIQLTNPSAGTLNLTWSATHGLNVNVYASIYCTSSPTHYCIYGSSLAGWTNQSSGAWNRSGHLQFPYIMTIQNVQVSNATLRGTVAESFVVDTATLPAWAVVAILSGGVLLAAMGGLAVFLGLFLRAGVYSSPEAVTPRYAHELNRPGDSLDEFTDEELADEDLDDDGPPAH
jgi:hypothetical protein